MATDRFPACIGSGYCCKKSLCAIAMLKYGYAHPAPCPSLLFSKEDDRYVCGEYVNAPTQEERDRIARDLSIGAGCCSSLNSDRIPILAKLAAQGLPKPMVEVPHQEHDTSSFWPKYSATKTRMS